MPSALTSGILVHVDSVYLESHSSPDEPRYVFAYQVTIRNQGETAARLVSRHWLISDAKGRVEEVQGPGVIG